MKTPKPIRYCIMCGNEHTTSADGIGGACRALLAGPLKLPYAFYRECESRNSKCCGGIATDKDGLYFHGKGWECSYETLPMSVSVEMGVEFRQHGAQTYYIRDFGNDTDSQEYGKFIPYAQDSRKHFWDALDQQLDKAAEHAWNDDLLSCPYCGNHYSGAADPCNCGGEDED